MREAAPFPRNVAIDELFGSVRPISVPLRQNDRVTILTGPNGSGKTHVLRLLRAVLALDLRALSAVRYRSLRVDFDDDRALIVDADPNGEGRSSITLRGIGSDGKEFAQFKAPETRDEELEELLPDYVRQAGPDVWEDLRDGELLSALEVRTRYGVSARRLRSAADAGSPVDLPDWLERFRHEPGPTLIETGRLDRTRARMRARRSLHREKRSQPSQIEAYIDRIESEMEEARSQSLQVSQRKDRQFAERALDKAREAVKEAQIRERYAQLADLNQALFQNGLTSEAMRVEFPDGRTNPTERRILDLFLDDWEAKLAPLRPVHEKLQLLRSIVDDKLKGKSMNLRGGRLEFQGPDGRPIPLDSLSSGEQHILALFTMLLFTASDGGVVLIDEPEISLHAAWKHAFLDDLRGVAQIKNLLVVAATHSTAIINGEWELVEELVEAT